MLSVIFTDNEYPRPFIILAVRILDKSHKFIDQPALNKGILWSIKCHQSNCNIHEIWHLNADYSIRLMLFPDQRSHDAPNQNGQHDDQSPLDGQFDDIRKDHFRPNEKQDSCQSVMEIMK